MINDLHFCTPEEIGLPSKQVNTLLDRFAEYKINLHSFLLARGGKIFTEAYYAPFDKDFAHRIYSCSKTYVALAIGRMITEGKLSLEDRIAEVCPDLVEKPLHKWMRECTVEDALRMAVPLSTDSYYDLTYNEWAWTFFNRLEPVKPGGTIFHYNTSGSFILDVLVEKLTGMDFLEYLRPVFDRVGVSRDIWCVKAPDGHLWGGSGVITTLRDFAKMGEFLLHRGEVDGEQLIDRDYMEKMTSKQISNLYENFWSPRTTSGYGYQTWITDTGWSMYGMGSQYAFCFPEKDLLFVCQSDTQYPGDNSGDYLYDAVKHLVYEQLSDAPLAADPAAAAALNARVAALELDAVRGEAHSALEGSINGVTYTLEENALGWKWFRMELDGEGGTLVYENARGIKRLPFGFNRFARCTFPETHYYDKKVSFPANRELDCLCSASWTMPQTLLVRAYVIDTNFGNCHLQFGFNGDQVGIMASKCAEFFMDDYQGFAGGRKAD